LRTFANWETSDIGVPFEPIKGVTETAAEIVRFCAPLCVRSVCKKERNFALSFVDTRLQPIPVEVGYSQLWVM
jgi:hypothetical protein